MNKVLLTNIGQLVTNEPAAGRAHGPLGIVTDAAVLVENGRIAWVGAGSDAPGGASAGASAGSAAGASAESSTGASADSAAAVVIDLGGRALIPGFVDSHSHIVFGGDRADEFEARMSGASYSAGGIRGTVAATRASKTTELIARARDLVSEMRAQGTTTVEVKSGYGLTIDDERRILEAASAVTEETTFLGAHVVPPEFANDAEGYVDLVVGEMLDACAPHARWIDVFCETGAFTPAQSRRILEAGAARGLGLRVHASQLGTGPGVRLAVELGAASVDHCTYFTDDDIAALAASGAGGQPGTVATLLPGVEFSTRHPYPDARRLIDAGVTVALASDCNPGSSFTSSMPFCIALAVRELRMTPAEALWAATAGGAAALRRTDIGRIAVGCRADLVELVAPSYVHLAYRPGVPLVGRVWKNGVQPPSTPSPEIGTAPEADAETAGR